MDPSVARIEPLLCDRFRNAAPIKVPRYQKFPLGDGQSIHLGKHICIFTRVLLTLVHTSLFFARLISERDTETDLSNFEVTETTCMLECNNCDKMGNPNY